ncbi:MAG: hypothetical protein AB7S93_11505 [Xanthobacteraceae bacterium]|jgi:uncharacterized membrane protein (GlpM family)
MPVEVAFWYGLLLKMVMTASIVVIASIAVERSGPFIGALIAALPTAAGAAYIILALEHPPEFIAASAIGSLAAGAAVSIFALTYTILAQRHGLVLSLAAATLVWLAAATALRLVEWTPLTAVAIFAVAFGVAIPLSARYRTAGVPQSRMRRKRYDIPLRAATAALVVAVVTTLSHRIGSFLSGAFAVFPIVMGSFIVILHPRVGGPAAASVLAHAQIPLIGLGLGFLAVHYLVEPIGVWWAYVAGLSVCIGWNGLLWLVRKHLP